MFTLQIPGNHRALKESFQIAPSLSFAATKEGSTSSDSPQTVTVLNFGNMALSFFVRELPPGLS